MNLIDIKLNFLANPKMMYLKNNVLTLFNPALHKHSNFQLL